MKERAPNTNIMVSVVSQTKICGTKQKNPPQHMIAIVYLRPSRSSAAYAKPIPTIPTKFAQMKTVRYQVFPNSTVILIKDYFFDPSLGG